MIAKNKPDHLYMSHALQLAVRGLYSTDPNPRVGCLIVQDGEIVGEGWHKKAGHAHAEIHALQQAGEKARGATVYVTLEPCCHQGHTAPCVDALIRAGVERVVIAMVDPNPAVAGKGVECLHKAGIKVEKGVLAAQAQALNPGFIKRMADGRPFIRCKLAMSMDGRTAMASGESKWITSEQARQDVQRLRARSSAIMTGIGTVLADDPEMTVRTDELSKVTNDVDLGELKQPLRIVIDSQLRMPLQSRLLEQIDNDGDVLIITAADKPELVNQLESKGVKVISMPAADGKVDLPGTLDYLAQMEINEVHLEAGATLSGAMLQARLVDEVIIYMAPRLMGDQARGLFHLPELARMDDSKEVEITDIRAVGKDWRITATIA